MIVISVKQPLLSCDKGKQPTTYFCREINSNDNFNVGLETIVNVLHFLFAGVNHTIVIEYKYNERTTSYK